jgi:branched-chain amino acid transport system ATP-binding protein
MGLSGLASAASAADARPAGEPLFGCMGISLDLGGREILSDISLSVDPGEVLGIIGPNGAGKTSLFEVLSGRMRPKKGSVFFRGRDVTALPLFSRARLGIGRTFQTPVVPDELTVGQTLKAARQAYKPYLTRYHAEWGVELVRLTAPPDMPTVQLDTLSRRKLLLACLLMRRPPLLLMDEPAAGLINSEVDEFDDLIRILSKEMNVTVIIVEHRIELLATIADRAIVMDAGEIISEGSLDHVLNDPKVNAAYFENLTEGTLKEDESSEVSAA